MTGTRSILRQVMRPMLVVLALTAALTAPSDADAPLDETEVITSGGSGAGGGGKVVIIPVHSEITDLTYRFIRRCLEEVEAEKPVAVVLDLETPGGMVTSALDICQLIKDQDDLRIVAWVNPEAYSAGAMISVACDEIVVASGARLGDCAPILIGPQGLQSVGEAERAKIESPILAEFRDSARRNGYTEVLSEAMVTLGPSIYRIKQKAGDEMRFVYADQLVEYGLSESADADQQEGESEWAIDKLVLKADTLLTMLGDEAIEYGFAKAQVNSESELLAHLEAVGAGIRRFEQNWSEDLVAFLTSPFVQGILTIILLMALYSEMQSPGLGLAGAVAVAAGAVLLGAPYLAGLAEAWEILLIVAGVGLLLVELLILPGFGVAGVGGLVLVFLGVLLSVVPTDPGPGWMPTLPGTWWALRDGMIMLMLSFVLSLVGMGILSRYFGYIPVLNKLMLTFAEPPVAAGDAGPSAGVGAGGHVPAGIGVGARGKALGEMHPIGRVEIAGQVFDAVTPGSWIESGADVRVVEVRGSRIVVEEA